MKASLIIGLLIGSFLIGGIFASYQQSSPAPTTLSYEDFQATPQTSPFLAPTIKPLPSTPMPTPTPANDYLSRLKKCLQDRANDPLNEEIKKDGEMLNNLNSSNFQCSSSPAECLAQLSRERAKILARISTNSEILLIKYDCFGTNFKNNSSGDIEEATLISQSATSFLLL